MTVSELGRLRWIRVLCRLGAITLGVLHTWAAMTSHSMNADGIGYLDIGDAYMRGDWSAAINSIWSPMYSWILAATMWLVEPSMRWEFPVVQLVNFALYLGVLLCFEYFWRQLTIYRRRGVEDASDGIRVPIPEWAWIVLGYLLFVTVTLNMIEIWAVTPDMLMAGFVFLAAALVVRVRLGLDTLRTAVLLGLVLGLGYLSKSVMFPMGLIFLAITFVSVTNTRRGLPVLLTAALSFILVSGPFIALISRAEGHLTYGGAGSLTYLKHVNQIPFPHWQGEPSANGVPAHPSRLIFEAPPIYEFGTPIGGTYPPGYDPSYWYEGATVSFDLKQQWNRLMTSALFYLDLFFQKQGGLAFGVILLYLLGTGRISGWRDLTRRWGIALVAVVAFSLYALVLVDGRYVGAFVALFWGDLLANVRVPATANFKNAGLPLGVVMITFLLINIAVFNLQGMLTLTDGAASQPASSQAGPPGWPGEVAESLHGLGVEPGDQVGVIGYAFDAYWARLARVRIVAEMPADPIWVSDATLQQNVIEAFAGTGVRAIVAEYVPDYAHLPGWHRVGASNSLIYLFDE